MRGNSRARVSDRELDVLVHGVQLDVDAAGERVLERIGQEVQHDLLPHVAIDEDGLSQRRAVDAELEPAAINRRPERARQLSRHRCEVRCLVRRLDATGRDSGEVEERAHELDQPARGPMRDLELCAAHAGVLGGRGERVFGRSEDQRERRGERGIVLRGTRLRERSGDGVREQLVEVAIRVVELEARARSGDEDGGRLHGIRKRDGQRDRNARRLGVGTARQGAEAS